MYFSPESRVSLYSNFSIPVPLASRWLATVCTQVTLDANRCLQLVSRDGNLNCLHADTIACILTGYLLTFYFEMITDV